MCISYANDRKNMEVSKNAEKSVENSTSPC